MQQCCWHGDAFLFIADIVSVVAQGLPTPPDSSPKDFSAGGDNSQICTMLFSGREIRTPHFGKCFKGLDFADLLA